MKKEHRIAAGFFAIWLTVSLCGCNGSAASVPEAGAGTSLSSPPASSEQQVPEEESEVKQMDTSGSLPQETVTMPTEENFAADTKISEVIADPAFGDFGRLIFPVDTGYWSGDTLGELRLTWYSHIDPDKTVEIANTMKAHVQAGETIFYDIYTEEEKAADPAKRDTGLFFFRGKPGSATPAGDSPMWGRCTIASPTPWSFLKRDTTPLPSSTVRRLKPPVRTWQGPSPSSSPMRRNYR
jgi:hypothetical protein